MSEDQTYQDNLGHRVGFEPSGVTNVLAPAVVESGEPSTIYTLRISIRLMLSIAHVSNRTHSEDAENHEKHQFLCMPILRSNEAWSNKGGQGVSLPCHM